MTAPGPVLVGADRSEASLAAVETAAREAALHALPLKVVHALDLAMPAPGFGTVLDETGHDFLTEAGRQVLSDGVARARAAAPKADVTSELVQGDPRRVLAELSRGASLTVVGSRGHGNLTELLLGSVARHLAAHAGSPVLVVRGEARSSGAIVLGVDGSAAGEAAAEFAFAEAAARGSGILALHAWSEWTVPTTSPTDPASPYAKNPGELQRDEERVLAEALSGRAERYPHIPVERRSVRGQPRQSLIEASSTAQLLVLGTRGAGGFPGLRLGSVSNAALHHADCPVAVVRGQGQERTATTAEGKT